MNIYRKYRSFLFKPVDARVHQLFRIVFGIVIGLNWLDLWRYRYQLFSDIGMIDPGYVAGVTDGQAYFSWFYHFHSAGAVDCLFILTGIAIFFMILGLLSRYAILWLYLFHLSYINLAFPAISGWDAILTIYLFILLISPLKGPWSLDAILRRVIWKEDPPMEVAAYGLYLMRYQLVIIYLSTAILKSYDLFWQNGEFYSYFMLSIYSRYPTAQYADWMWLSKIMTWATLAIEFIVPVLLFFKRWKWLAFILGFGLHIGILVSSNLTLFSLAMLSLYIPFLSNVGKFKGLFAGNAVINYVDQLKSR